MAKPVPEIFEKYVELVTVESERGSVLLSTGYLEQKLKEILLAFLIEGKDAEELVDSGNAPLATFSARTTACYVLGLINADEQRDLHLLRKIRNDFAHDMHTSFSSPSVESRCKELHFKASAKRIKSMGMFKSQAHGQCITSAVALMSRFDQRPFHLRDQRRAFTLKFKEPNRASPFE